MSATNRWPTWVYNTGEEPDYRFSFANERTFLAWIRTSLSLIAAGVALDAFKPSIPELFQRLVAAILVGLGLVCALSSWVRWARSQRAIRRHAALPSSSLTALLSAGIVVTALAVLVTTR
jgi:putative membrane protein